MYSPIAEINLQNLLQNCKYLKSLIGECQFFPVVKADAYGHGIFKISKFLNNSQYVDGLCVAMPNEAELLLSQKVNKPIFVLGKFDFENELLLSHKNIIPTIHCFDDIAKIKSLKKKGIELPVQLKLDTGMGRMGIDLADIHKVIDEIKNIPIDIIGIWSHLSSADEENNSYTQFQINNFKVALKQFNDNSIYPKYIHIANSSAIFSNNNSFFNSVRPGISIYGISPLGIVNSNLKPVMKFKLPLIKVKSPSVENYIGYNRLYKTDKNEKIGIFQGGYADGVGSVFNNNGNFLFEDNLLPIRGKISMDMTAVDISNSNIKVGDYATLWGENTLSIEKLSKVYNVSPYEFLVNLSDRVERVYFE